MNDKDKRAIVARARARGNPETRRVARARARLGRPATTNRGTVRRGHARAMTIVAGYEARQAVEVLRVIGSTLRAMDSRAGRMPHPEKERA